MTLLLMGLLACTDDVDTDDSNNTDDTSGDADTDADADTDTDTDTDVPASTASGSVTLRDGSDLKADTEIVTAFSYYTDKKTFIYATSNPSATCQMVGELYEKDAPPVDLNELFLDNHCNVSITLVGAPPVVDYDLQDGSSGVVAGVNCAYGEGEFVYEGGSDAGYFWDGPFYNASAFKETLSIEFHDQGAKTLKTTLNLGGYRGVLSTSPDEVQAQGYIKGEIYSVNCEGLSASGGF
jgi:hypothetical protein